MPPVPIADDLFTWPDDEPRLIGGRCGECGAYAFPLRTGCPRCGATAVERTLLERSGTLWTWTSQGFLPKAPFNGQFASADPFEPWFVGVVELPGQLRVESILVGCPEDGPAIGMPMRLVTMPFRTDEDGREIVTFAFTPDESSPDEGDLPVSPRTPGEADHA
ncbi:Zn-ribbon domain-containing OB-fold protein [Actinomadura livida]|uniref:OB-fold domain-containing protein n=1 Tax=Actinomadura livida TaxID=79909 RepID=A0A7W7IF84_9ACTN|nr:MULTISPECIES: OB-fold domain-containing protein [Actinomadura]MBB4776007.1 putative OB-fold protein [Actinomadura catellatispora]GGU16147.1 DNA-binding protein [Actinomadura livida]